MNGSDENTSGNPGGFSHASFGGSNAANGANQPSNQQSHHTASFQSRSSQYGNGHAAPPANEDDDNAVEDYCVEILKSPTATPVLRAYAVQIIREKERIQEADEEHRETEVARKQELDEKYRETEVARKQELDEKHKKKAAARDNTWTIIGKVAEIDGKIAADLARKITVKKKKKRPAADEDDDNEFEGFCDILQSDKATAAEKVLVVQAMREQERIEEIDEQHREIEVARKQEIDERYREMEVARKQVIDEKHKKKTAARDNTWTVIGKLAETNGVLAADVARKSTVKKKKKRPADNISSNWQSQDDDNEFEGFYDILESDTATAAEKVLVVQAMRHQERIEEIDKNTGKSMIYTGKWKSLGSRKSMIYTGKWKSLGSRYSMKNTRKKQPLAIIHGRCSRRSARQLTIFLPLQFQAPLPAKGADRKSTTVLLGRLPRWQPVYYSLY